jgi:hypothetical protein
MGLGWTYGHPSEITRWCGIGEAQLGQSSPEPAVRAVTAIGKDYVHRRLRREHDADMLERDLRLGLKNDLVQDLCFFPAFGINCPDLRNIKLPGYR